MRRSGPVSEVTSHTAATGITDDVTLFWEAHLLRTLCYLRDSFTHSGHSQVTLQCTCAGQVCSTLTMGFLCKLSHQPVKRTQVTCFGTALVPACLGPSLMPSARRP